MVEKIIVKTYLKLLNPDAKVKCYNFTNEETDTMRSSDLLRAEHLTPV